MPTRRIASVPGILAVLAMPAVSAARDTQADRIERAEQALYHIFDRATTSQPVGGGTPRETRFGTEPPRNIPIRGTRSVVGWSRDDFDVYQKGRGIAVDLTVHPCCQWPLTVSRRTVASEVKAAIAPRIKEALGYAHAKSVPFRLRVSVARR